MRCAMIVPRQSPNRRTWVIAVVAVFIFVAVLVGSRHRDDLTKWTHSPPTSGSHRVAKVSMLYGEPNQLYERAIKSHQRHATRWGYPMHVLREDISVGFWNKPTYLLSLVVEELTKPVADRVEWLMWVDADSIILNNAVPVEIFLPPYNLTDIHMVASKDQNGLNTGIMFLRVHPWTISMLTETMGYPLFKPEIDLGRSADQEAMGKVLDKTKGGPDGNGYKDNVIYVSRPWINTYEWVHAYEGKRGNLLVHFPGLEDQRWPHMAKWLDIVEATPEKWDMPLEETEYFHDTADFWRDVGAAKSALEAAKVKLEASPDQGTGNIQGAVKELRKVLQENAYEFELLRQKIDALKMAAGLN